MATPFCYVGPAVMIAADVITITLNRHISPLEESISGYAAGPFGWPERVGMAIIALCFLTIAFSLLRIRKNKTSTRLKLVGALLCVVASGFIMLTIFNTNVIATIISFHGFVHEISTAAVSIVFYLACLILMRDLFNRPGLRFFGIYNGVTFLIGLFVLLMLSLNYHANEYMGLLERLIATFNLVWIALVGPHIIKLAKTLQ
jgi:hypothetical protein